MPQPGQAPHCEVKPAFLMHCPSPIHATSFIWDISLKKKKEKNEPYNRGSSGNTLSILIGLKLWGYRFGNQMSTTASQSRTVLLSVIMSHEER